MAASSDSQILVRSSRKPRGFHGIGGGFVKRFVIPEVIIPDTISVNTDITNDQTISVLSSLSNALFEILTNGQTLASDTEQYCSDINNFTPVNLMDFYNKQIISSIEAHTLVISNLTTYDIWLDLQLNITISTTHAVPFDISYYLLLVNNTNNEIQKIIKHDITVTGDNIGPGSEIPHYLINIDEKINFTHDGTYKLCLALHSASVQDMVIHTTPSYIGLSYNTKPKTPVGSGPSTGAGALPGAVFGSSFIMRDIYWKGGRWYDPVPVAFVLPIDGSASTAAGNLSGPGGSRVVFNNRGTYSVYFDISAKYTITTSVGNADTAILYSYADVFIGPIQNSWDGSRWKLTGFKSTSFKTTFTDGQFRIHMKASSTFGVGGTSVIQPGFSYYMVVSFKVYNARSKDGNGWLTVTGITSPSGSITFTYLG